MENNYFIFTEKTQPIVLERFHICTWEFRNNSALIEFGGEIKNTNEIKDEIINLEIYIPWLTKRHTINDLYEKLKEAENSRFIFNDSVSGNKFLDDGQKKNGVIQEFVGRTPLCIMPFAATISERNRTITISINLKHFQNIQDKENTNLYFRFYIEPNINLLSTRKAGISRSTIIYDVKINEKRNLPENFSHDLSEMSLCKINNCFFFNILPNSYDLTFFDTSSLKNIRTLEFDSFKKYIGDDRVKKDELVVVFNKKKSEDSYAFFSIYSNERIGAGQLALAVLVNLISGILLFIPSLRKDLKVKFFSYELLQNLPLEVYISGAISLFIIGYFLWPKIVQISRSVINILK
jgi:hypothetical protein